MYQAIFEQCKLNWSRHAAFEPGTWHCELNHVGLPLDIFHVMATIRYY